MVATKTEAGTEKAKAVKNPEDKMEKPRMEDKPKLAPKPTAESKPKAEAKPKQSAAAGATGAAGGIAASGSGKDSGKIAVIRVRGIWSVKPKIRFTLGKICLNRVNHCVIVNNTPEYIGMLKVCKDYVAFGPISEGVLKELVKKRARKPGDKKLTDAEAEAVVKGFIEGKRPKELGIKAVFRLRPPSKGYKSIKKKYPAGALGKWKSLDSLLSHMM